MFDVTTINFHGDNLQAVRDGDRVWVVVKRVCEALGITEERQVRKLKTKEWAVTALMAATGPDGRNYEMFCLDIDSLHGWLFSIEPRRVKESVRGKLVDYQKECARVLRDHFFGRPQAERLDSEGLGRLFGQVTLLVDRFGALASAFGSLCDRVTALEQNSACAYITSQQHRQLKSTVHSIASSELACGKWRSLRQATADLYGAVREECDWGGKGRPFYEMPMSQFPIAMAVLNCRRIDADRMLQGLAARRQQELWETEPKH